MPDKTMLEILDALRNDTFTVKSIFSSVNNQYKETIFIANGKNLLITYANGNNIIGNFSKDLIEYIEFYDSDDLLKGFDIKELQEDLEFMVCKNYKAEIV